MAVATLADINKELSIQGDVLEDTRAGIKSVADTVKKQLAFFTGNKLDKLEEQREKTQTAVKPASNALGNFGKLAAGGFSPGKLLDFLKGLLTGGALGGLLGLLTGMAGSIFTLLKKLLKGAFVLMLFPYIKNFADDLSSGLTKIVDTMLQDYLGIELSEEQKKSIKEALSLGLTSGLLGLLFGLGLKRSLVAVIIGAGFVAVSKLFPDFAGKVEDNYNKVLDWLATTGPAGAQAAAFLRNNSELAKSVFVLAGSVIATALIPAAVRLSGLIIGAVFAKAAALFAGATISFGAAGMTLLLGTGAAILLGGGYFIYKLETDPEFKKAVKQSVDDMFKSLEDLATKLYSWAKSSVIKIFDNARNFLLGVDLSKVDQNVLTEKDKIRAEIDKISYQQQKEIAQALQQLPEGIYSPAEQKMAITDPIILKYKDKLEELNKRSDVIQQRIDLEGTADRTGGFMGFNSPMVKEYQNKNLKQLEKELGLSYSPDFTSNLEELLQNNNNNNGGSNILQSNVGNTTTNDNSNTTLNNNGGGSSQDLHIPSYVFDQGPGAVNAYKRLHGQ